MDNCFNFIYSSLLFSYIRDRFLDEILIKMNIYKELKSIPNPSCEKKCNKEKRESVAENDICEIAGSVIDELPLRCVGEWAFEKIYLLVKYFGAFSTAMKNKWEGGINYIEICSGPGRCINRSNGYEFNGTSLAIIDHPAFLNLRKAIFFDADLKVIQTLQERISIRNAVSALVLYGDYNNSADICKRLSTEILRRSLNLVFIDPTDCSVPFDLIRSMKKTIPNMDLIINVASKTDFNRNVGNVLLHPESYANSLDKYSRFLGASDFFRNEANLNYAKQGKFTDLRNNFREFYKRQLEMLGYKYFDFQSIHGYYDLLFASSSNLGYNLWKSTSSVGFDGQRKLF